MNKTSAITRCFLVFALFGCCIVAFGRVIPENDIRIFSKGKITFDVDNSGCLGCNDGIIFQPDSSRARYTYGSGWLIVGKSGGEWFSLTTTDLPIVKASAQPGPTIYGKDYIAENKDYQQVYAAEEYDRDTGFERFGGIGPRWPMWRGNVGTDLYNKYGPYGRFVADTTLLAGIEPDGNPYLPAFPENLLSVSISKLSKPELNVSFELLVFYSVLPESDALVTTARLSNKSDKPLEAVYLFHYTDTEITSIEFPFSGTTNDFSVREKILIDTPNAVDFITSTSYQDTSELNASIANMHQIGLWHSSRSGNGVPLDFIGSRNLPMGARTDFISAHGRLSDIFMEGEELVDYFVYSLMDKTAPDSVYGDIFSANGYGPYYMPSESHAELMTAAIFTEPPFGIPSRDNSLFYEKAANTTTEILAGDYLTSVSRWQSDKPFEQESNSEKEIYYRVGLGFYLIIEGEITPISISGRQYQLEVETHRD